MQRRIPNPFSSAALALADRWGPNGQFCRLLPCHFMPQKRENHRTESRLQTFMEGLTKLPVGAVLQTYASGRSRALVVRARTHYPTQYFKPTAWEFLTTWWISLFNLQSEHNLAEWSLNLDNKERFGRLSSPPQKFGVSLPKKWMKGKEKQVDFDSLTPSRDDCQNSPYLTVKHHSETKALKGEDEGRASNPHLQTDTSALFCIMTHLTLFGCCLVSLRVCNLFGPLWQSPPRSTDNKIGFKLPTRTSTSVPRLARWRPFTSSTHSASARGCIRSYSLATMCPTPLSALVSSITS